MNITCNICPHACELSEGSHGYCGVRSVQNGEVVLDTYGYLTSIALDPIEKKPLRRFHPGSYILSVGSYGCNMRCPFCQNHVISMPKKRPNGVMLSPNELIELANQERIHGNIGIAYTYNEPFIAFEYIRDCMILAKENGLYNVVVTNGYINMGKLEELLPYIDAMNIDLKGFRSAYYQKLGGDLESVKKTIAYATKHVHVEVTTLLVTDEHCIEEIEEEAKWLASLDPQLPLHLTRFFPNHHMRDRRMTPLPWIEECTEVAKKHLAYVYKGNC